MDATELAILRSDAQAILDSANGYRTWDREAKVSAPPWKQDDPALIAWEKAHNHDVRSKCFAEYGCQLLEVEGAENTLKLLDEIDALVAQGKAPDDLARLSAVANERDVTCDECGSKPGSPCYGNGPLPRNHHRTRLAKAERERLDQLLAEIERLKFYTAKVLDERDAALAKIDAALAIHKPHKVHGDLAGNLVDFCEVCDRFWPCVTARALGVTK